jgi:hypothetical protein
MVAVQLLQALLGNATAKTWMENIHATAIMVRTATIVSTEIQYLSVVIRNLTMDMVWF